MIVTNKNEFICINNENEDEILNYTPEFDIKFVVPYGNYIMLSSEEPNFNSDGEISTWDGKYIGIDTLTGEKFSINEPKKFYLLANSEIENNINYPVTINGKSIPHPSYPNGSDQYNGIYKSANGWGSGEQCQGFGFLIYDYLYGSVGYKHDSEKTYTTVNSVQSFFKDLPIGTFLRCSCTITNYRHTMILLGQNSDGIYVYHANWIEGKVTTSFVTWSQFLNVFPTVYYIIAPHYVPTWTSYSTNQHRGLCSVCDQYHYGKHYAYKAGVTTCVKCGYYGNMIGMTKIENVLF